MADRDGGGGPGEISTRYDWAATPLGPFEHWQPRLQAQVEIVLSSAQPMYAAIGKDLIFIHNEAYGAVIAGMADNAFGQPMRKVFDAIWPELVDMFAHVMAGRPKVVENMKISTPWRLDEKTGFFSFSLVPLFDEDGDTHGFIASLFETTQVRKIQSALAVSEARQAFLLNLSDVLRPIVDPRDIRFKAAEILGRHLGASRVAYGEDVGDTVHFEVTPNYVNGTAEASGLFSYTDFGPHLYADLSSERVLVQPDIANDKRLAAEQKAAFAELEIGASMNVPLVKSGRLVAFIGVNYIAPHDFQPEEIELVREVAERTWAAVERARAEAALRDSETRLAAAFESVPAGLAVIGRDGKAVTANAEYRRFLPNGVIPSRDPERVHLWQAWDEDGNLIPPKDYPGSRALRGERVIPGLEMLFTGEDGAQLWARVATAPTVAVDGTVTGCISVISDITARREAEEKLRLVEEHHRRALEHEVRERTAELHASRDLLQASMDASTDMIQVFEAVRDDEGAIIDFRWALNNHAAERVYGDVVGERLLHHNPGVAEEGIFGAFKRVTETGQPEQAERHYVHEQFDGWFYQSVVKLGDGVATTTKDITNWKSAQTDILRLQQEVAHGKLRESEERFRLLVESIRDYAIFTMDRDGNITSWPAGAARVYGWTEEEMLGRSADLTFIPEDVAACAPQQERDLAARDGLAPNVCWHLRKDGSRIFIDGSTQPLLGADGRIREFIKIGQDVTEARRVQKALSESEERLRTLAEGIPQLVWRSVAGGQWTWSSPQWQSWTAQSETASLGMGWLEAVHPDDRDALLAAWASAPQRGVIDIEHRLRRGEDGHYLWHHTRSRPVHDESGAIVEWLGTTTDVQQLKQMQERQAIMVAELQHRTRNLIAVVKSIATQTMEMAGPTEAFREEFGHRLDALARVQGLLSRADKDPITIEALIRMELDALGAKASIGHVHLEGPPVRIRPSVVQTLALALHELATNARKYGALSTRDGRLNVTWRTSGLSGAERLILEWVERGGKPPNPEAEFHRGYGRELIEEALPYSLDAQTVLEHDDDGLRCRIEMPLERTNREHEI